MKLPIFKRHTPSLKPLRAVLLGRKAELLLALELNSRRLDGAEKENGHEASGAPRAERVQRVLSGKLSRIEEALQRMKSGSFGACARCGEAISEERLRVLPWETHCAACQENRVAPGPAAAADSLAAPRVRMVPIAKSA